MAVLVTGGAGYIGAHAVLALVDAGRAVVVLDDLSTGRRELVPTEAAFVKGDVGDAAALERLFAGHAIDAVMHFAARIVVPESMERPLEYYRANTAATLTLIEACARFGVRRFVFSSTAAVYGMPRTQRVDETAPTEPISPYGASKLMAERMLADAARADPTFRPLSLRYFNVAGADPAGRAGQSGPESTHLIRAAVETVLGQRDHLDIFGNDYQTRDGTGERDYIHVSDLAQAHVAALEYLEAGGEPAALNCGYGRGFTVREVIAAVERVTNAPLPTRLAPRRPGDPGAVISDPSELMRRLAWRPARADLEGIVASALAWARKLALGEGAVSGGASRR